MSSQYIRRLAAPLALGLALAACGGDAGDDALASDSALNRDLALAGQDSGTLPSLTDTLDATPPAAAPITPDPAPPVAAAPRPTPRPSTPRPAASRPTPTRPSEPATTPGGNTARPGTGTAERELGSIPAGTSITLTSNERVCTNTHKVGDRFTATVAETVRGNNGAVIPAGATAVVRVTELKRSENANDEIRVGLDVVSLSVDGRSIAVNATTNDAAIEKVRSTTRGKDVQKVVGGAIVGAIAGQILGKDTKSTVIGAATGAAAGTGVAAATANFEGCVGSGGRIVIALNDAATFPVSN